MHGIASNTTIAESDPPSSKQAKLKSASSCHSAGRSVALAEKEEKDKPSFQYLAVLSSSMIYSCLQLRDIASLERVCTRLRDGIKHDNALAKAWYRRFPSPLQYQLRTAINTKNVDQLREWFESFTNDQVLVKSLTDRRTDRVYMPALLFFTKTKLMSECKTFELDTTTINEKEFVNSANLSVDGRHLVTAGGDCSAIIYVHKADGSWEITTTIPHHFWVNSATFSPDGRRVVTASVDNTAKIYSLNTDGSWELTVTLVHEGIVESATFSADGLHVVTASADETAQIHSQKTDGSWELTAILFHSHIVNSANFSTNCRHVVTASSDHTAQIHSLEADGSWKKAAVIFHKNCVNSASFSPDSRRVVTASDDNTAKIYVHKDDGAWEPEDTLSHTHCVNSANFSPDGRYVATASKDGSVRIYKKANGSWKQKAIFFHRYGFEAFSATFSPDGRHLVTTSGEGTAKLIGQMADGSWSEKASVSHNGWIYSATFSADGRYVVTASNDKSVKITELRSNHSLLAVTE
ncbi:WD40 repeat domain-containing protein [Endozoicomonas sp. ISHI1]|uniref:WD40 repeat domain-containing protein n=2 Tax=unclassified Endozoicomonas TaxID=2644528 RepID=UPI002149624E|nr:WD40 repeat domain-containing protein [Endozoicomonas sp. ISHI1]